MVKTWTARIAQLAQHIAQDRDAVSAISVVGGEAREDGSGPGMPGQFGEHHRGQAGIEDQSSRDAYLAEVQQVEAYLPLAVLADPQDAVAVLVGVTGDQAH